MTYNNKTVVSVSWASNADGTPTASKNIQVLFDDNTVTITKYETLIRALASLDNQIATATARVTDTTNLKALCESTLSITP